MKRVIVLIGVILAAGLAGWWYLSAQQSPATAEDAIFGSGSVEAEEVAISAEVGGRIAGVLVDEGDEVVAGQVLVRLDDDLLVAQIREAEAAVAKAKANLARVEAGPTAEEVAVAEAELAQAEAQAEAAKEAWEASKAIRDNPQELDEQIIAARTQVALAAHRVEQARADLELARVERDRYPNPSTEYYAADQQVRAAEAALRAAEAAYQAAQASLNHLLRVRDNPLEIEAQVHAAEGAYRQAEQAVKVAQAALEAVLAGPTAEEVQMARAQVRQAQASLAALQVQRDKLTLQAPLAGLVTNRAVNEGEAVTPGARLLTVADLDQVTVTIYVPETLIGRVKVGQKALVRVDSFPERTFEGEVIFIASRAEFTPKNVQTAEERVNLVFRVKVRVPNPDHALKPGMPADVTIVAKP
jgi:multidrug resistance efflux pump